MSGKIIKRLGFGLCVGMATTLSSAWALDYAREIEHAKKLTAADGKAAREADAEPLRVIKTLEWRDDKYVDECDRTVSPKIIPVSLGEKLKETRAIIVRDDSCYGEAGSSITIVDGENRVLWQEEASSVSVLSTKHQEVNDLSFGMTGSTQSVWRWNDDRQAYVHMVTIEGKK